MTSTDLYLMDVWSLYQRVKLPAIVIEHINTVMITKDWEHGSVSGLRVNRVFAFFNVKSGKGEVVLENQIFALVKWAEEDTSLIKKLKNENIALHERVNKLEAKVEALTLMN